MSLRPIVAVLGGDLYQNGLRANVPAPGHSANDRSVSLMMSQGRVVAHGFGAADWRAALDDLRARSLVDPQGRLIGATSSATSAPLPDRRVRIGTAVRLWDTGVAPTERGRLARHLARRGVDWCPEVLDLREHPAAPLSVYRDGGRTRPAMMARIAESAGTTAGVELTYLEPNGDPVIGLRASRKTVGTVPAGSAVRLSPVNATMLVGEGVLTVLSAMRRFRRPGWALLSAGNLARWFPPLGVRDVLVAGDRGSAGERAAGLLAVRLRQAGIVAEVVLPPDPWGDWNEVEAALRADQKEEEGR